jgi:hypothetical protein
MWLKPEDMSHNINSWLKQTAKDVPFGESIAVS